jgi:Spy/CpxP family protein refolding chaperone
MIERAICRIGLMKLQATVLAGLIAAGLALPAVAQDQQPPAAPAQSQQQHGDRMMHRFDDLNLSDQQKSQIQTLLQNYRQAHPRGSAPDPDARKQLRDQINAVLTPDQQAKLKADEEKFRAEHQGNAMRNVPPAPSATPI